MTQFTVESGDKMVLVTVQNGVYSGRVYVNYGLTMTTVAKSFRSERGVRAWAAKWLAVPYSVI